MSALHWGSGRRFVGSGGLGIGVSVLSGAGTSPGIGGSALACYRLSPSGRLYGCLRCRAVPAGPGHPAEDFEGLPLRSLCGDFPGAFVYGAVESVSLRGDSGTYAAGHDSRGHPGLCRPGCGVSAAYGDQSICESGPAGQGRPAGGPPGAGSFGCGIAPHSPGWAGLCAAGSGGRLWTGGLVWVPATGRHVRGHFRLCPYPGRAGRCGGFDFDEVTV